MEQERIKLEIKEIKLANKRTPKLGVILVGDNPASISYIKGKGIKDLYFIKIARVGTRKEGQPDNDPNDLRLVFEIEFVKQLFEDYKKVHLDIWQTFKDTILDKVI